MNTQIWCAVSAAFILGIGLAVADRAAAQAPTSSIEIQFDCPDVPWACSGGRFSNRWQLYRVSCDNSGCRWKWERRAEPGIVQELRGVEQYRLYIGPDGDSDSIYDCSTQLRSTSTTAVWEWFHDCDRWPDVCRGESRWQLYHCADAGTCNWAWDYEIAQDCVYVPLELNLGRRYLLHWGTPRELEVAPTATPTRTPRPTNTPRPSSTPSPTDAPTEPPTITPTEPNTPTIPTQPTSEPKIVYLPLLRR